MKIFIYFFIFLVDLFIKRFGIDNKNIVLMLVKLLVSLNEIILIINDEGNGFENVKVFVDNFFFLVYLISRLGIKCFIKYYIFFLWFFVLV